MPLPSKRPAWLKSTRDWWKIIWRSPMRAAWVEADIPVLLRLARLIDAEAREPGSLAAEIRQIEDRYGLSPLARRKLEWEIAGEAETPEAGPKLAPVRRLRAVDPNAATPG